MKNSLVFPIRGLMLAACLFQVALCSAQEVAAGNAPLSLDQKALENAPALAVPVSFETKRKPLGQLLSDVSKQSGVPLSLAPESLQGKLVTARVATMPLSELMSSLARLYGASWEKTPKGYMLRALRLTSLEKMSLHAAGANAAFHGEGQFMSSKRMDDLQDEIFDEWLAKNEEKFEPLVITGFSEEVQLRLRQATVQRNWFEIFRAYRASKLVSPDSMLHLMRHENRSMTQVTLSARASDDRHTMLFQWMSPISYKKIERPEGWPAAPLEAKPEQPDTQAPEWTQP